MRSNASLLAVLLLLAGCGGGRSYYDTPLESAPPPQGSVAAQAWGQNVPPAPAPGYPQAASGAVPAQRSPSGPVTETWRAADGSIRTRQAAPARQQQAYSSQPGASYAPPQTSYTAPQPAYSVPQPAVQDGYPDPAAGATGPSGSSQPRPGEVRYDEIGYAGIRPVAGGGTGDAGAFAVHRSLPPGSYVEVTSLDTGKTVLVLVTGPMEPGADHPMDLSAGAARLLGYTSMQTIPVRIRRVNPPAFDQGALRAGQPAAPRPDAPRVLLDALRKRLPGAPSAATASPAQRYTAPAATRAPSARGYFVQVAALSSAGNAQALAQRMGGFVKPGGGLYRVQLGPFATPAQAEAARQRAAGAGFGDARVFAN